MTTSQPLNGITVFEIGHSVAGPFAGSILAQLGAEVIKVENDKRGDYARDFGPPYWHGAAANFHCLNRDKFGVCVDLSDPAQAQRLRAHILERADVLVHNLRPGSIERHGLGAEELVAAKPELIYCSIGSFGRVGPLALKPGYDPLMQAYSGLMSLMGEDGRPPVRVPTAIQDIGTGMWAAIGILAALRERQLTGKGGVVDASLYETALSWMMLAIGDYLASGEQPKRYGSGVPTIVPHQAFRSADQYIMVAAGNDRLFAKLADLLGHPEWVKDERFATNGARVRNRVALADLIQDVLATRPAREWIAGLEAVGIPCSPIQSVDEVVADAQTKALGIIQQAPTLPLAAVGLPLSFDGQRPPFSRVAPSLGEHTKLIFADEPNRT